MDDMISRQAAIDALAEWHDPAITNRLNNLPSAQRWIPCSERLPEEWQECLVSYKGHIFQDTFIGHGGIYNWRWSVREYEAWMPLPEPWKGEPND